MQVINYERNTNMPRFYIEMPGVDAHFLRSIDPNSQHSL